jgi:hypothetical protein
LRPTDLLVVTADHGNDPATPSTDHSREHVPVLIAGAAVRPGVELGTRPTFADLGQTLADVFGVAPLAHGESFWGEVGASGAETDGEDPIVFKLFFMIWLALKVKTLRPSMMISSPVWGFLPLRGRLVLTTKLPKPEIFTLSPFAKHPLMMSKVASTTSVASFFEKPTFS